MLNEKETRILKSLKAADGLKFSDLVEIAGLDPKRDFRGANLQGINFANSDLTGFDFSDADLSNAVLKFAKIEGARFDGALIQGAVWPSRNEDAGIALHEGQAKALATIGAAIRRGQQKILVSTPPGFGRSLIIEQLFKELAGNGNFRDPMLVVSTVAERQQYKYRFSERFSRGDVPDIVSAGQIERANKGEKSDYRYIGTQHITIVVSNPGQAVKIVKSVDINRGGLILLFTTMFEIFDGANDHRIMKDISSYFGEPVFYHSAISAFRNGEVTISKLEVRSAGSERRIGSDEWLHLTVNDLANQIEGRFIDGTCVVVCADQQMVFRAAGELKLALGSNVVVPIAANVDINQQSAFYSRQDSGRVIVMTKHMALSRPAIVQGSALSATLTKIPAELSNILFVRPATRSQQAVVLDYANNSAYAASELLAEAYSGIKSVLY